MNIADFITELYCKIDDTPDFPQHPQAVVVAIPKRQYQLRQFRTK